MANEQAPKTTINSFSLTNSMGNETASASNVVTQGSDAFSGVGQSLGGGAPGQNLGANLGASLGNLGNGAGLGAGGAAMAPAAAAAHAVPSKELPSMTLTGGAGKAAEGIAMTSASTPDLANAAARATTPSKNPSGVAVAAVEGAHAATHEHEAATAKQPSAPAAAGNGPSVQMQNGPATTLAKAAAAMTLPSMEPSSGSAQRATVPEKAASAAVGAVAGMANFAANAAAKPEPTQQQPAKAPDTTPGLPTGAVMTPESTKATAAALAEKATVPGKVEGAAGARMVVQNNDERIRISRATDSVAAATQDRSKMSIVASGVLEFVQASVLQRAVDRNRTNQMSTGRNNGLDQSRFGLAA